DEMLDGRYLLMRQAFGAAHAHDDRGAWVLFVAREELAAWQHEMDARGLDEIDRGDGAAELAFERPHLVDVLDEARRAERVRFVEELVADRAAMRQVRFRHGHAQPRDLIGRHQDLRAVAADLVGHVHGVELLDDLTAVAQVEVAVEEGHARRGDARRDESEEADHGGGDAGDHGKTQGSEAAQSLEKTVQRCSPRDPTNGRIARMKPYRRLGE